MSKIILSTILALGFLFYGVNSYADNEQAKDTTAVSVQSSDTNVYSEVSGKVTSIDGDTITVMYEDGNVQKVNVPEFRDLQELQVETLEEGDRVVVMARNGKPYAISKVAEPWSASFVDMPDVPDFTGSTTVKGRVTEVDGDKINFKSKDGSMHSVKITGMQNMEELQTETIEVGDIIIVNVRDGKPYGINKHLEAWSVSG
jgi:predicted RNA-binding protein with PUA domain